MDFKDYLSKRRAFYGRAGRLRPSRGLARRPVTPPVGAPPEKPWHVQKIAGGAVIVVRLVLTIFNAARDLW